MANQDFREFFALLNAENNTRMMSVGAVHSPVQPVASCSGLQSQIISTYRNSTALNAVTF